MQLYTEERTTWCTTILTALTVEDKKNDQLGEIRTYLMTLVKKRVHVIRSHKEGAESAKDFLQELLETLYKSCISNQAFNLDLPWLNKFVWNIQMKAHKKFRRRDGLFGSLEEGNTKEPSTTGSESTDAKLSEELIWRRLSAIITAKWPVGYHAELLRLRTFNKLSHDEISISLNISSEQSKKLFFTTRQYLHTILNKNSI